MATRATKGTRPLGRVPPAGRVKANPSTKPAKSIGMKSVGGGKPIKRA